MPFGIGRDIYRGTRKLDKLLKEDPAAARALTEQDVSKLMKGKPTAINTLADGTRNLIWLQSNMKVGIVFTKDHLFNRIYTRVHV
jgi:hypothetical protein